MKKIAALAAALTILAIGASESLSEAPTSPAKPRKQAQAVTVPTTSTSTTTTLPVVAIPASASCPQWWPLAVSVGWPESELAMLDRVIFRESRCLPDAFNGHDAGLTQINQIHREFVAVMGWQWPGDMFNAELNLRFALKLWQGSGWRPWGF